MKNIAGFSDNDKRGLFRNTADKMGINDAIVEKDFWVCFTLDWRVLGYGREEPWEKRSNTKQDAFNKEANARAEVFLAETFCPVIKEGLSQELGREADIHMDEDGKLIGKADMFTKRTIRPDRSVTSVDMSPRSGKYPIS